MFHVEYEWTPDADNCLWGEFEVGFDATPYSPANYWGPAEGGEFSVNYVKLLKLTMNVVNGEQDHPLPELTDELRAKMEKDFELALCEKKFAKEFEDFCLRSLA